MIISKMSKTFFIIFALSIPLILNGCVQNRVPLVNIAKVQTYLEVQGQRDYKEYQEKIIERRKKFEMDIDAFFVRTLNRLYQQDVLSPDAVIDLLREEARLRREFDANEKIAMNQLADRVKFYHDNIVLLEGVLISLEQAEADRARIINEVLDLTRQEIAQFQQERAMARLYMLEGMERARRENQNNNQPPTEEEHHEEEHNEEEQIIEEPITSTVLPPSDTMPVSVMQ